MPASDKSKQFNKKMTRLYVRYFYLINAAVVVIIIALGYLFVIAPKLEVVSFGGQYNIDTLIDERNQKMKYLSDLKNLLADYDRLVNDKEEIDRLMKLLPRQKDIPGLFVQFQNLATDNDFFLQSINFDQVQPERQTIATAVTPGEENPVNKGEAATGPKSSLQQSQANQIKKLNVTLDLAGGNYTSLKDFLEDIELNLRVFDINAVHFNLKSKNYSVSLFTYYLE